MDSKNLGSQGPGSQEPDPNTAYWEGTAAFFNGREARSRPLPIAIGDRGLEIRGGTSSGLYGRNDLRLLDGRDGYFRLALKSTPGSVLEFRDREAWRWAGATGLFGRRPGSRFFSEFSLRGKITTLIGLSAAIFVFIYFIGLGLAVRAVVSVIPPKVDGMLGRAVMKPFEAKSSQPKDSLAVRALEKSARAIMAMDAQMRDTLRIIVVADTSVKNAFAFPGGYLLVYTGMLHMLGDQEEWLGLLAHEAGHVSLRHGMRGIVRGSFLAIMATLVLGDASGVGAALLDNAGTLVNLNYGRRDEAAADDYAWKHLEAAGHPPEGMLRLFGKFLAMGQQPKWAVFLSTHPATSDRIARIRSARKDSGPETPDSSEPRMRKKSAPEPVLSTQEWVALKGL